MRARILQTKKNLKPHNNLKRERKTKLKKQLLRSHFKHVWCLLHFGNKAIVNSLSLTRTPTVNSRGNEIRSSYREFELLQRKPLPRELRICSSNGDFEL